MLGVGTPVNNLFGFFAKLFFQQKTAYITGKLFIIIKIVENN